MQCKNMQRQLIHYVQNELSGAEYEKISAHLRTCIVCGAVAKEYTRLAELSENLPEVAPPEHILAELKRDVYKQISASREADEQSSKRFVSFPSLSGAPRFAYAWGSAFILLLVALIWFGNDWNLKSERRTLESYLEHRDYFSLWNALKKPDEQKRLLADSVSIDLLVQTFDRYDEIKKRYGRFRSASASFASVIQPIGRSKNPGIGARLLKLNELKPVYFLSAKKAIQKIHATRDKMSANELVKHLKMPRLLFGKHR
ncbi:MAG: hypothetical protein ACE5I1_27675 [bacterium]